MHLITVIKRDIFRKYHIKQSVFRDDVLKTKNILSFHTVWAANTLSLETTEGLLSSCDSDLYYTDMTGFNEAKGEPILENPPSTRVAQSRRFCNRGPRNG